MVGGVRIKRGYGRMSDGRTSHSKSYPRFIQKDKTRLWYRKRFSSHSKSYPRFIKKDKTRIWYIKRFFLSFWIKRGYGLEWLKKRFLYHIRVLSYWIKRGYDLEWLEKRFLYHNRVLSFWIKRGYDLEWLEKRFLYHNRVLSFWIKRGYDLEWLVRPSLIRPYPRFILTPPTMPISLLQSDHILPNGILPWTLCVK